ncbi:MBOAT family protein [Patescibacteria group bacterium]|nr:MBOAT family protein [Patescibacteria group bacterium]
MLFNSFHFLIFFPTVVFLFFVLPKKWRLWILLIASYYFYMSFKPDYVIFLVCATVVSFFAARKIYETKKPTIKKAYLSLCIVVNVGILFTFKYVDFFTENFEKLFSVLHIDYAFSVFSLLLPIGISFYTFQALSYCIDVYTGKMVPEKRFHIYALYVSFFPQLVAGPIERAEKLIPQFKVTHSFSYERATSGLKLMTWGFFKKLVIADRLGLFVDSAYGNPSNLGSTQLIIATIFFAFQIYCDFSGYTDIARGVARVLGFQLVLNFKQPYFAKSISDFWRRWHISLYEWFKDYVYIPLGGNRVVKWRWYYNIIFTFLLSGLWHGAAWTFVIWGVVHGVYLVVSNSTVDIRKKCVSLFNMSKFPRLYALFQIGVVFFLVCFAWIFFRADSLGTVLTILKGIGSLENVRTVVLPGASKANFIIALAGICFLIVVEYVQQKKDLQRYIAQMPIILRWAMYSGAIFIILGFGIFTQYEFIYFQF